MTKKTVLITGATKGIGLASSERLARNDWEIIGIARSKTTDFPGKLFLCDLSNRKQTNSILKDISEKHDIDAIVNNVGISLPQPLNQVDLTSLDAVYDLNVRVALQTTQEFLPHMKQKQYGRIVNIASRAIFGIHDRTSYSAAKSALVGCTKTWAVELADSGITVNAVAPGPIETELFRKTRPIGSQEEQKVLSSIPMKRLGTAAEVAAGVEFLLSKDSGFITGQVLCIDGGGSL